MTYTTPLSTPPPLVDFSVSQANPLIAGFDKQPLHEAPAKALEAVLERLSQGHPTDDSITWKSVSSALQSPPYGHSKQSVTDLRKLLLKFAKQYAKVASVERSRNDGSRRSTGLSMSHSNG